MPYVLVSANLLARGNKLLIGKNACIIEDVYHMTGTTKIKITYRTARGTLKDKIVSAGQMVKCA